MTSPQSETIPFIVLLKSTEGTIAQQTFTPRYPPKTFRVNKERQIDRSTNFCRGEDVVDNGTKNREIHIAGKLVGKREKENFNTVIDSGATIDVSFITWSGEAVVEAGELEGPVSWDPSFDAFQYLYTMDIISTGVDVEGELSTSGIVERPDNNTSQLGGDFIEL